MSESSLGQKIKELYAKGFLNPFPLDDVRKLRRIDSNILALFHGQLELYLGDIAGYASGADRLHRRPKPELVQARQRLSQSFFEKHASLRIYEAHITEELTPSLFNELSSAERLRQDLLVLIDQILSKA